MGLGGTRLIVLERCTALHADTLVLRLGGCHLIGRPCVTLKSCDLVMMYNAEELDTLGGWIMLEEGTKTAGVTLVLRGP